MLSHAAKSAYLNLFGYLFLFLKWAIKLINSHVANCLWNDSEDNHKYHLVNWENVSMCNDFGGLGIPRVEYLSSVLLVKKYHLNADKL